MKSLKIRKVQYYGDKYWFKSPYLGDGIVILEAFNQFGKTTFSSLIYYGLGGKVEQFEKLKKKGHTQIISDSNNYVTLDVEINSKSYSFQRFIGETTIYVTDNESRETIDTTVKNRAYAGSMSVFTDWLLEQLEINVFQLVQGSSQFYLGFNDLFRLMYFDQISKKENIYKDIDDKNTFADTKEVRKAIFEVLFNSSFEKFYVLLSDMKRKEREVDEAKAALEYFNDITNHDSNESGNVVSLMRRKEELESQKNNLERLREFTRKKNYSKSSIINEIQELRDDYFVQEKKIISIEKEKNNLENVISKFTILSKELEKELSQLNKLLVTKSKFNFFGPDTCPYCLNEIERKKGKCVCGSDIDENEYMKFFYTLDEYKDILMSKRKTYDNLIIALQRKNDEMLMTKSTLKFERNELSRMEAEISDLRLDIDSNYNSSKVRKIDKELGEVDKHLSAVCQKLVTEEKRNKLISDYNELKNDLHVLREETTIAEKTAKLNMETEIKGFENIYNNLMIRSLNDCDVANIRRDNYMPEINFGEYRASSDSVSTRFNYYLALLLNSLGSKKTNFLNFLLIDTPQDKGIDLENLKIVLELLNDLKRYDEESYQVIMTTGANIYPNFLKDKIVMSIPYEKKNDEDKIVNKLLKNHGIDM